MLAMGGGRAQGGRVTDRRLSERGVVFYEGPSLLTGDRIIGAISGLRGESKNAKTGPMAQAWILRQDAHPMDAKRANQDDAICGDCKLRGRDGRNSGCYVAPWLAPNQVWKSVRDGHYRTVGWPDLRLALDGLHVRLGAYGDPAALPFEVWRVILSAAAGHVAYTHAWRSCDPRLKTIAMASVDTEDEFHAAHLAGWRTFRIRRDDAPLLALRQRGRTTPLEFACPASDESSHRTTCQDCQLCRGTASPARSVAIVAHGKPSSLRAFGIRVPIFGRRES